MLEAFKPSKCKFFIHSKLNSKAK